MFRLRTQKCLLNAYTVGEAAGRSRPPVSTLPGGRAHSTCCPHCPGTPDTALRQQLLRDIHTATWLRFDPSRTLFLGAHNDGLPSWSPSSWLTPCAGYNCPSRGHASHLDTYTQGALTPSASNHRNPTTWSDRNAEQPIDGILERSADRRKGEGRLRRRVGSETSGLYMVHDERWCGPTR